MVAGLVRTAVDADKRLSELSIEELREQSELLDDTHGGAGEFYEVLASDSWLESKVSMGGTALPRVREQLELARTVLGDEAHG